MHYSTSHESLVENSVIQTTEAESLPIETFETRFSTTLKHSNASKFINYSNFFDWQGQARENWFMQCVAPDFLQAEGALVTWKAHMQFFDDTYPFHDVVCKLNTFDVDRLFIKINFDFLVDDKLVARGYQQIALVGYNKRVKRFPVAIMERLKNFEITRPQSIDDKLVLPSLSLDPALVPANRRFTTEFRATISHSNATKNVYFANYLAWQSTVRDQWLYDRIDPTLVLDGGKFKAVVVHNNFLKETFPFDTLRAEIYTFNIQRTSFNLGIDFISNDELVSKGYQKLTFTDFQGMSSRLSDQVLSKVKHYEAI